MPPPARLAQRLCRHPRPGRGHVPFRAEGHESAASAALHPRDHGPRDDLAHADRLAHRPGPARDRAGDRGRAATPTIGGRPETPRRPAHCSAWPPASVVASRWSSTPMPVFDYGEKIGAWTYDGDGYDCMTITPAGRRRAHAVADLEHRARCGRGPLLRPHDARVRRDRIRRAVVDRPPADDRRRGAGPAE